MNYRRFRISRLGLPLVVAAAGCVTATTAEARGPRPGAGPGIPQGPIFKTLDAMAGGIQYVLQRTVLSERGSSSCDDIGCDDACDHLTLQQLEPLGLGPHGQLMPHPHMQGPAPLQPMHGQPMYGQPMHGQPMHGQPMHGQPRHGQPMHEQPMHEQPMHEQHIQGGQSSDEGQVVPRGLPRVPSDHAAPPLPGENGRIESFSPAQPQDRSGQQRRRLPRDAQYDTLPNPFLDDQQGGR